MDVENQQALPLVQNWTRETPSPDPPPTALLTDHRSDDLPYDQLLYLCVVVIAHLIYASTPSGAVVTCQHKFWLYLVAPLPFTFFTCKGMTILKRDVLDVRGWRPGMTQTRLCYAILLGVSALLHVVVLWDTHMFCRGVESRLEI